MNDAILIHDTDDVLVALRDLKKGETVNGILLKEDIPQAHKIALLQVNIRPFYDFLHGRFYIPSWFPTKGTL